MRNDYRVGRKTVTVVMGGALHAQVKAGAAVVGSSMNEWLVEAIREKVTRDGDGVVCGGGCVAASGGGFDGVDPFGVGGGVGGERAVGESVSLTVEEYAVAVPAEWLQRDTVSR